jgi:hypothetical protein
VRFKSAVVLLLIVVIGTTTFPVTGQEEPLPAIQAKGSLGPLTRSIVLPAEPAGVPVPLPTLEDAARANDYVTFEALYRDAARRGDSAAAFAPLHELWTYGITDPVGAFYGPDIYERLTRAYPTFASYIAEYRIVDSNGNVFYPTSETRTFLLERALEGRTPGVQLVDGRSSTQRTELRSTTPGSVWDRSPVTSQRSTQRNAAAQRTTASPKRSATASRRSVSPRHSTAAAHSGTPASSQAGTAAPRRRTTPKVSKHVADVATKTEPKAAAPVEKAPVVAEKAPVVVEKAPVVAEKAPVVVEKTPVVADQTPVAAEKTPAVTDTATTITEAPVVVRGEPTETATVDAPATAPQPVAAESNFGGRGVLLLVIGLIGVGLLAMMLRTPREVPASIMQPPDAAVPPPTDKPSGPTPVEPLRRPSAAPEPPPPGKNRAGGSHG